MAMESRPIMRISWRRRLANSFGFISSCRSAGSAPRGGVRTHCTGAGCATARRLLKSGRRFVPVAPDGGQLQIEKLDGHAQVLYELGPGLLVAFHAILRAFLGAALLPGRRQRDLAQIGQQLCEGFLPEPLRQRGPAARLPEAVQEPLGPVRHRARSLAHGRPVARQQGREAEGRVFEFRRGLARDVQQRPACIRRHRLVPEQARYPARTGTAAMQAYEAAQRAVGLRHVTGRPGHRQGLLESRVYGVGVVRHSGPAFWSEECSDDAGLRPAARSPGDILTLPRHLQYGTPSIDRIPAHYYIALMSDQVHQAFAHELKRLEKRLDELVAVCNQLREENRSLRHRQDTLIEERASLLQKNEQVRARVEAMIGRLKSMEHGA